MAFARNVQLSYQHPIGEQHLFKFALETPLPTVNFDSLPNLQAQKVFPDFIANYKFMWNDLGSHVKVSFVLPTTSYYDEILSKVLFQ